MCLCFKFFWDISVKLRYLQFFGGPKMVSIYPQKIIYVKQHLASNSIELKNIMKTGHCKQQTKAPKQEQTSEIHFHLHFQEITSQHF